MIIYVVICTLHLFAYVVCLHTDWKHSIMDAAQSKVCEACPPNKIKLAGAAISKVGGANGCHRRRVYREETLIGSLSEGLSYQGKWNLYIY